MTAATAQASYCQKKVPLKKKAVVGSATVLADAASEMFSALAVVSLDHNIVSWLSTHDPVALDSARSAIALVTSRLKMDGDRAVLTDIMQPEAQDAIKTAALWLFFALVLLDRNPTIAGCLSEHDSAALRQIREAIKPVMDEMLQRDRPFEGVRAGASSTKARPSVPPCAAAA
jgi:hypothetical protein